MNTQEAVDYANKYGVSKPYLFENHNRPLYAHYPSPDGQCTTYSRIVEGYIELSLSQFKKDVLKQKPIEKMKAETFAITGEKRFLELMWQDLLSCGYRCGVYGIDCIGKDKDYTYVSLINYHVGTRKQSYAVITVAGGQDYLQKFNKQFSLPKEYNEALAFAKEQLSDKYWIEIPEYVKCTVQLGFCVVGKIYKTRPEKDSFRWLYEVSNTDAIGQAQVGNWDYAGDFTYTMENFEPATKEEYVTQQERYRIIEEAKKRYPIGCKVKLLDTNVGSTDYHNEVRHTEYSFFTDQLYVDGNLLLWKEGQWAEIIPAVKLPFGDVIFTIESGSNFATTSYGKISKKEIADAIRYLENPPTLGGYGLTFFNSKGEQKDASYIFERVIGFGCQKGKLSELKAILKAFD
jgi:hypothetical protein